ncbi:Glutamyl-tRNA reductase [Planctomycetales bacterium 10988]|nr:Glutamyl-tRNA reductase [Planctomycetales bacterium 10988]
MKLAVIGCDHHHASVNVRERLAFSPSQAEDALTQLHGRFPGGEAVLLSTCNRVELYTAFEDPAKCPSHQDLVEFLADFHGLDAYEVFDELFERTGEDAVRHLFTVAASLDSMVVGDAQILSQVKQAYELASQGDSAGPLTHSIFQAALRVAKRVATETSIHQNRVSIPSVAVADFAKQIFETFTNKEVLVIGAGEMGQETLRYLRDEGAEKISVINRSLERAQNLAEEWKGTALPWEKLEEALTTADIVVSTTGATEPIMSFPRFGNILERRKQRSLMVLDLAIPRDFDPDIADLQGVYLYDLDSLSQVCQENRQRRDKELPQGLKIIEEETSRFMTELNHRATSPVIRRLREGWQRPKEDELKRLLNRLPDLDEKSEAEIRYAFDRLVNKLLHPPLESLRDEAKSGVPHTLLQSLKTLFKLTD